MEGQTEVKSFHCLYSIASDGTQEPAVYFWFFKEAHGQTAMGKSELVSSEAGNQMGLEILAIKGRQGGRGCTCLIMDGLLFCLCMSRYRLKTSSLCCLPDTLISF
jgi:hypothetical protein